MKTIKLNKGKFNKIFSPLMLIIKKIIKKIHYY